MANPEVHIHNKELEGPLPEGFSDEGREGKVRNIYINEDDAAICLIASDRVSAFDQVSPTPITGKGEILNDIAQRELIAAQEAGIPTWLWYVPEENPRAAVGRLTEVLPAEMIFRNYMTGSMWREYEETGDFTQLGLAPGLNEWYQFYPPLFTPSTKAEKDVNFHPDTVEKMTDIDLATFREMEEICRELFRIGTARAADNGLILVDTKYEMGLTEGGDLIVIDEVHTPDSSRFVYEEGFAETVANGQKPKSLSKEFLRGIMLERAGGNVEKAKQLMAEPLPSEVVEETRSRYQELHQVFTGQ